MSKKDDKAGGCLVVFAIIAGVTTTALEWIEANKWLSAIIACLTIFILFAIYKWNAARKKREHEEWIEYLWQKYQDNEIVNLIVEGKCWVGQTEEQLEDSIGEPDAKDRKVLKTKTKEVWKYGLIQKGQYRLKVTLENRNVVGWDKKDH